MPRPICRCRRSRRQGKRCPSRRRGSSNGWIDEAAAVWFAGAADYLHVRHVFGSRRGAGMQDTSFWRWLFSAIRLTIAALCVLATMAVIRWLVVTRGRSEEHTSELQSLMRISYAVFCLQKKKKKT